MSEARKCPMCDGTGMLMKVPAFGFMGHPPCGICGGRGEIVETEADRLRAALVAAEKFIAAELDKREDGSFERESAVWTRYVEPARAVLAQVRAALGRPA